MNEMLNYKKLGAAASAADAANDEESAYEDATAYDEAGAAAGAAGAEADADGAEAADAEAGGEAGGETAANPVLAFVNETMPELANATDDERYAAAASLLRKYHEFGLRMEELFSREPEVGELISEMLTHKKDFTSALMGVMSSEEHRELEAFLEAEGGDGAAAVKERRERYRSYRDGQSALEANVGKSAENISAWIAKKQWDEAKQQDFCDKLTVIFGALKDGVLTDGELDQLERMIYFDDAVSAARDEGLRQGRNEKIDASRLEAEARRKTDGLPKLQGGGSKGEAKVKANPLSDVIAMREARRIS
jgi:hypothetical protein